MNTPADPDGDSLYAELEAELDAMIASGVADPEGWFCAAFTPAEAQRWDGFGWTTEGALGWIAALRADRAATADWRKMGMDPVDPFWVLEARAVGLLPTSWRSWRLAGYSHDAAVEWTDLRFTIEDALAWVEAGFPEPTVAAEWTARGSARAQLGRGGPQFVKRRILPRGGSQSDSVLRRRRCAGSPG